MKSNDNYEIVGCDANVAMVDSMIASLFKDLSHTRDHYISFDVTQLPSDFSPYLAPFSFKAAVESEMRAELALSVSNTLPPTAALKPLSPDEWKQYESVLVMRPPKTVTRYTPSRVPLMDNAQKKKRPRQSLSAAAGAAQQGLQRFGNLQSSAEQQDGSQAQIASIYDEEEGSKRGRKSARHSRGGSGSGSGGGNEGGSDDDDDYYTTPSSQQVLPANFYELVIPLFNVFFQEEYEDKSVMAAFFAVITQRNCEVFGLENFASQSFSFPIINEKLQSRSYSSKEEFFADFKQGLENVLAFYPQEHPAIDAAKQIWARFQVLWREASAKFQS